MIIYTKLAMIVLGLSLFKNIWQKDSTYIRSSKVFTDCDFYYCEAWSPPVQMDTYDSEMRGLIIAISHQSHFSQ